ncbi:MAG: biopolymer transporter ExbD [Elusimicrobiota bacterium]
MNIDRRLKRVRSRLNRNILQLDSTPMTDVVFLLLIFFMLSSSFLALPGIKINVPKAVTTETDIENKVIISIDKNQKIYINDKEVNINKLLTELPSYTRENQNNSVIIKADKSIEYGVVVDVIDIVKQSGVKKIAIATIPKSRARV